MAQGKVEICGVNTAKLPILKEEEKEALFARIKQGDQQAKEEYIKGNLRLVLSVIKRFGASNENPDDLFQIGCIGLIKAIDNFNIDLGRALLHLRRAHDRGGDSPLPSGQQLHAGLPFHAGHGL